MLSSIMLSLPGIGIGDDRSAHDRFAAVVELALAQGEGPFDVDARYEWLRGRILTSVRIRPRGPAPTP